MNPTRHAHTGGSVSRGTIPMGAASSCAHALQKLRRRLLVHPGTSELAQVGCVRPAARRLRQNTVIVHAAAEACTIRLQRPATARGYCYWRGGKQRWRFEYNGVVYITVETCRHEITTWPGTRTRNFDSKFLQKFREISRNFDWPAPGVERLVCGPAAGRNGCGNGS